MNINTSKLKARFVDTDNNQFPRKQQFVIDFLVANNIEIVEYSAYKDNFSGKEETYIALFFARIDDDTIFELDNMLKEKVGDKFEYIKIDEKEFSMCEFHILVSTIHPYKK